MTSERFRRVGICNTKCYDESLYRDCPERSTLSNSPEEFDPNGLGQDLSLPTCVFEQSQRKHLLRNQLTSAANCALNPKCCYESHDLECPNKFNPPLLTNPTEFSTEALAKRIPIPKCILQPPQQLKIERIQLPLTKPPSSRHLKNWQKWCYIWRQTYNTIASKRNTEIQPPIMSSMETARYKQEDKELFERTLHKFHMTGFFNRNAYYPASLEKNIKCHTEKSEIQEVITKRYLHDYPEMKRHRYSNYVRNEVSLPSRRPTYLTKSNVALNKRSQYGFNWEEQWAKTEIIQDSKDVLGPEISTYGKDDPHPDKLILKPAHSKGYSTAALTTKRVSIPQLVFSAEPDSEYDLGGTGDATAGSEERRRSSSYYNEERGPVLRIRCQCNETRLKFSTESMLFASVMEKYLIDTGYNFSITTQEKAVKYVVLENEGTAAIRYQWFRNPPSEEAQRLLQDATLYKTLRLSRNPDVSQSQSENFEDLFATESSEIIPNVSKEPQMEFHFSEIPDVILPGQTAEFPIIFRSKSPGFFHETLYLVTHPKIITEAGKEYAMSLSGVCADEDGHAPSSAPTSAPASTNSAPVSVPAPGDKSVTGAVSESRMEEVKNRFAQKVLDDEANRLMEAILERAFLADAKEEEERIKHFEEVVCEKLEELLTREGSCDDTIDWNSVDVVGLLLRPDAEPPDCDDQETDFEDGIMTLEMLMGE